MTLENYISKAAAQTKAGFSNNKDKWVDYLMKYELRDYFKDAPEEKKTQLKGSLEKMVNKSVDKYDSELNGLVRKVGSKGTMGLAVANDIYSTLTYSPIANATGFGYALFGLKTIAEAPALYRYVKKSKDWYGAAKHMLLKPIRYLLPIIGPALEAGALDRMVKKRIMKESASEFIKEFGDYVSFEDTLKEKASQKLGNIIELPVMDPNQEEIAA